MKRALKHSPPPSIYHVVRGQHVEGAPPDVRGDLTGVRGDLTGVRGDLTGVRGDLDACELTDAERERGVHISELIERESAGDAT